MKTLLKKKTPIQSSKIRFWSLSSLLLLSISLSLSAHADQITTTDHTVQVALEPLSLDCEWDDLHRVYKISLSLSEAMITPPVRFISSNTIYSTSSSGVRSYDQCVNVVRDIHHRYPYGSSFVIRRTLKESWESGCRNDRCPKEKTVTDSVRGNFDEHIFSSNRWE